MQINKFPLIVKRILMAEVIGQAHQLGQNEKAKKNTRWPTQNIHRNGALTCDLAGKC